MAVGARLHGQDESETDARPPRPVTWRALLLGLLLLPLNLAFIVYGMAQNQSRPTTVSLYFNVVATLLVVVGVNALLRRANRRWALRQGEMLTLYAMLTVGSAIAGHDGLQVMVPIVGYPQWYATPENDWQNLFLQDVPQWLTVSDPRTLAAYYDGHQPLLATAHWHPWVRPALLWSGFTFVLVFVMLCFNTLFRRNWVEEAKLSYPVVQLPLEMTSEKRNLFSDKLFWIGFGLALAIDAVNGFHWLYPQVPSLMGGFSSKYDLGHYIVGRPWSAIGRTPLNVLPFVVGLAFFMPLDLAFSCWVFYLLWKFVRIAFAAGWGDIPEAPWMKEHGFGAYAVLAGFSLWASRKHIRAAVASVLGRHQVDDSREPMPYSWALIGILGGITVLMIFCMQAKMTFWPALGFIVIYLIISIAVARIRAELGSPVHDLHFAGPDVMIPKIFGARALGKQDLIGYAFLRSFTRAQRSHPMPNQIEAMKMGNVTNTDQRGLAAAMTLAAGLALALGWFMLLDEKFRYGGEHHSYPGREAFSQLDTWLTSPGKTDWYGVGAMISGALFTVFLAVMRTRYVWWPLHPAGYVVSGTWSMMMFAPSILVSWLAKALVLHYGGMKAFAPASKLFLGLILGEFVGGAGWGLSGILMRRSMYNFLP